MLYAVGAMHCHNTVHMLMGMMVALEEAPEIIPVALQQQRQYSSARVK